MPREYVLDLSPLRKSTKLWEDVVLPTFDEVRDFASGKSFFSALDLKAYDHQLELDEPSKKYTAHEGTDGKVQRRRK